ncbi:MAG: S8 family serine peptidase, partial [Gemmatimonadaceae bacterium]
MKQRLALVVIATVAVSACVDAPTTPTSLEIPASFSSGASDAIPGRFIVTLRDGSSPAGVAREHGVAPDFVYTAALNGFAGSMSEAARSGLLRDARVSRVEPDGIARASTTQSGATWGLDRIDQRALPLSGTFTYTNTGSGVTAYIIDTGIDYGHAEFGGRATFGYDAFGGNGDDCNGHGTHVAGTVGGSTYGVAK